ncbi:MAG: ABC transporter substrate-binding protein [Trueperaceae bacterium]
MDARLFTRVQPARCGLAAIVIALVGFIGTASAIDEWEMRVCASPYNAPMSSRENGGFNNRIAEILADELGARVTYEWVRLDAANVQRTLLSGECDVIVGIAEGASNVLSTVPYLRAPYVFVTREDSGIEIESINDPTLRNLRIGTYQQGIPAHVLDSLGISENVTGYPPVGTPGGSDLDAEALRAVAEGEVDVGILYGPKAAAFDADSPVDLRIEPVTPEVISGPSLIVMSRTWTIGVRPGDDAFRDRLNIALGERWEEIRAAIAEYGVPQADVAPPFIGDVTREEGTSVGVIVPGETGGVVASVSIGEPARRGAILAESVLSQIDRGEADSKVLYANAPTDEAAYRAAMRMVVTERVGAIVGGFGAEQAQRLGEIATEAEILFFNVAATSTHLRRICSQNTFHIEASSAMLADAAAAWYADEGVTDWFLVHEDSPAGNALLGHLEESLAGEGERRLVGVAAAEPSQFLYSEVIDQITSSGADGVLLALEPGDQELFISQFPDEADSPTVVLIPRSMAQSRELLLRFGEAAQRAGAGVRPVTWDASLSMDDAGDLNSAYLSRNAAPMEPTAWTTYAAVMIFHQAVVENADRSAEALTNYLTAPERTFELGKGVDLSFRQGDHQLRQPIYLVHPNPDVEWSRSAAVQADLAEVVARVPSFGEVNPEALDSLGVTNPDAACAE